MLLLNDTRLLFGFKVYIKKKKIKKTHDENIKHTFKSINKSFFQIAFNSLVLLISASKLCGKRWKCLHSNDIILSFLRTAWIVWKKINELSWSDDP